MPKEKLFEEDEVLKKAMLIFWEKGYKATSVEDLVQGLGISRSSLYDTFKGKQELFDRVLDIYRKSHEEGLKNFMSQQEDVIAGLRMIFQKVIWDDHKDEACKGCMVVNTTIELLPSNSDSFENQVASAHKADMEGLFRDFLQKGVDKGQIAEGKDLETFSRLFYTLMSGLRVIGKTRPDPEESMAAAELIISLLEE